MNEKEYKAQKAVGTVDFEKAARETKSKKVLASIVEDTQDIDTHIVVATNPYTDIRTLTRLIIDRDTSDHVLQLCIMHPSVTKEIEKA